MRNFITTRAIAVVVAIGASGTCLADGHHGECASQLDKLTPYWEEMGFGQHGDITGFMRLSHDGRYMVSGSFGNYFVPGVPGTSEGGTRQIYLLDREAEEEQFSVVTVAFEGAEQQYGNGPSGWLLDFSPNGRYVAFTSTATNLVEGAEVTGEFTQVYLRDLEQGITTLASVSPDNEPGDAASGFGSVGVSNNGRVVFSSIATNLAPDHGGGTMQTYVFDSASGEVQIVSLNNKGQAGESGSSSPAISADGSFVTFNSPSSLDPSLPFNFHNVWGRDLDSGITEAISVDDNGNDRFGVGTLSSVSADGRHIAFMFDSNDPLDPSMPNFTSLYVRDRISGTTRGLGTDLDGNPIEQLEYDLAISADGRYVAWDSWSFITTYETFDQRQVYRVDMTTGEIVMASIDVHCQPIQEESDAIFPTMSGDGSTVLFTTVWDVMQDEEAKIPHDWAHHTYAWTDPDFQPECDKGDLNCDGTVNGQDLLLLLSAWGECPDPANCPADLNGDGVVNGADLLVLLGHWG